MLSRLGRLLHRWWGRPRAEAMLTRPNAPELRPYQSARRPEVRPEAQAARADPKENGTPAPDVSAPALHNRQESSPATPEDAAPMIQPAVRKGPHPVASSPGNTDATSSFTSERHPDKPTASVTPDTQAGEDAVVVADLTAIRYLPVPLGFAPPPGWSDQAALRMSRRWSRRSSRLRETLVSETVCDLADRAESVAGLLQDEPVVVLWPSLDDGSPGDFLIPEPDPSFLIASGDSKGNPRTLDRALPGAENQDVHVDDFDRLELMRLVAILLDGLHRRDIVLEGAGWRSFAFTVEPRPRIVVLSAGHLRRLGGESLEPPTYVDADAVKGGPFDTDRYRLALLAYRVLVSGELEGDLSPWVTRGIPGLSTTQLSQVSRLWERSIGPAGTRPQAAEWRQALGA